jgi:predicted cytidylate kinase
MYNKITISGKICTGKSTLFHMLTSKLEWETFSTSKYFRTYAAEKGFSIGKAEEQNKVITQKVDYMVRDMLSSKEHLIAEGWMTGVMGYDVQDACKVLLTCPDTERFKRYSIRESVTIGQAKKEIMEREKNLLTTLYAIYGIDDILDPKRYNVVIDTSKHSLSEVLDLVLHEI